jgi:hypothetical protein
VEMRYKIVIIFLYIQILWAQSFHIKGIIIDHDTKEALAGANVYVPGTILGTTSDKNGLFSLDLDFKPEYLEISFIGYERKKIRFKFSENEIFLKIMLKEKPLIMSGVVVEGQRTNVPGISMRKISNNTLKNIPPLGEPDVLHSISFLPEIQRTGDWKASLSFSGTAPYQSGIFMNNSRIYNPFHFFGILGSVNPEFVHGIEIYTSAVPIWYENVTSGVVNILNNPFPTKKKLKWNISLLSTSFYLQNSYKKIGFQIGLRKTYFDIISRFVSPIPYGNIDGNILIQVPVNRKIYTEFFFDLSNDFFTKKPEIHDQNNNSIGNFFQNMFYGKYNFGYINSGANVNYSSKLGNFQFHYNMLWDYTHFQKIIQNKFYEKNAKIKWSYRKNKSLYSMGITLQKNDFHYYWISANSDLVEIYPPSTMEMDSSGDGLMYQISGEYQYQKENVNLIFGLAGKIFNDKFNFNFMSGINFKINKKLKLNIQGGYYSQNIASPFSNQELTIKNPLFVLNRTANSLQGSIGLLFALNSAKSLEIKVYGSSSNNLPYWDNISNEFFNNLSVNVFGTTVLFTDKKGLLTYQLYYELNHGVGKLNEDKFLLDWNITHTFKGIWGLKINNDWYVNWTYILRSGYPYTPIYSVYTGVDEKQDVDFGMRFIYGEKNSKKFPFYARMDISLRKLYVKKKFKYILYLQVINLFNRKNIMRINWRDYWLYYTPRGNSDSVIKGFPVIPSIGIEFMM